MNLSWKKAWPWLLGLVLMVVLAWQLQPILLPFLLGAILAYFGDPLVDWLETHGLSRTVAVSAVFAVVTIISLLVALLMLPLLGGQLMRFISVLPSYAAQLQELVRPILQEYFDVEIEQIKPQELKRWLMQHWDGVSGLLPSLLTSISRSTGEVLGFSAGLVMAPVITFYLLRDWDLLVGRIRELLPRRNEPAVVRLAQEADEVLGAFMRGQLLVMLSLGLIYSLGLWLIGLEFAILIGLMAGLLSFVPYLGSVVGVLTAVLAVWLQTQSLSDVVWVLAVFGIGQLLEGVLLTPWLVGDRIGLHPVAVIFAVLAGGQLFGFLGMLLALPVAAVVAVMLREAHRRYLESVTYQGSRLAEPTLTDAKLDDTAPP